MKFKGSEINSCWEACIEWFLNNCEPEIVRGRESIVVRDVELELSNYDRMTTLSEKCLWSEKTKQLWIKQIDQASQYSEMERLYKWIVNTF